MGENSGIQWTTHTFNPWVGCQRVSPGCTNCYAEAYDKRVGGLPKNQRKDPNVAELRWGPKAPRVRTSVANWKKPIAWNKAAADAGRRDRVFCSSLADVFEDRPELHGHREDLFGLIQRTPMLDWLLLTKRPKNIARLWPRFTPVADVPCGVTMHPVPPPGDAWPNVWLGTTVEDQQRADERIPHLLSVPAAVRFLSMEPLLEHVELGYAVGFPPVPGPRPDWIIIGGESGPGARPFHTDWARDLVGQAHALGAAAFVKQMGANPVAAGRDQLALLAMKDPHGGEMAEWPADLRVREFPRT